MNAEQLRLPLETPPLSFEEISATYASGAVEVELSRRLKRGWYVTGRRGSDRRKLTVPAAMAEAPEQIKSALVQWALLPFRTRRGSRVTEQKKQLENAVRAYMLTVIPHSVRRQTVDASLLNAPAPGRRYDLREIFDSINRQYFDSRLQSILRWGAPGSITSYQTHRPDGNGNRLSLITIAGAYDHPRVPQFALEAVMYHEMLHLECPPRIKNGRRCIHGPDFKRAERAFPFYQQWCAWEQQHLRKMARSIKRSSRRS